MREKSIGVRLLTAAIVALATLACESDEGRVQSAREEFERAFDARDQTAMFAAIDDLEAQLPESVDSLREVSNLLGRVGDINRAIRLLEAGIERYPAQRDLRTALAGAALMVADPRRALAALDGIPRGDPNHELATKLRANAQRDLGDLEESLATLAAAESEFDDWTEFRVIRVEMLVEELRYVEALELVRDARRRDGPDGNREHWFAVSEAGLLVELDRQDEALAILGELNTADPADTDAWKRRFNLLMELERLDELSEALATAIEQRPDVGTLYDLHAMVESRRGNDDETERILRRRFDRVGDIDGAAHLVQFLRDNGRTADAVTLLREAQQRITGPDSAEVGYLLIAMLLSDERSDEARRAFEPYEREHWNDARAEYLRARFELDAGEAEAAAERLKRLLSRFDRSDVHHWLGVALELSGNLEGAEFQFGLAVNRNPNQISSYIALIRMLERRGDWKVLELAARQLLSVRSNQGVGLTALNRALIQQGRSLEAVKFLSAHVEEFPEQLAPAIALSVALRSMQEPAASLALLDRTAADFGAEAAWRAERAFALGSLGRGDEGLALLERTDVAGDPGALHHARAFLLLSGGRRGAGLAEVERAIAFDARDPAPLRLAADYHSQSGDFEAAAATYERYLELAPKDAEVVFRLGAARHRLGDVEGAIAAYRRAVAIDADAVAPRNNLALTLAEQGRFDEALPVAQQAYARADANPVVLDTLGWIYLRSDRVERAVKLLEKARALDPAASSARYHLALAYAESGRAAEARVLLDELDATLDPHDELRSRVMDASAKLR